MIDARCAALDVLERVEDGARSDAVLGQMLERHRDFSAEDRALATRIVYGVLAWRLRIDHTLARFSGRVLEELDRPIVNVLRVGVYQLAFLDRIPAYAAVDRSVALVPRRLRRASGFVNAILRRVSRDGLAPIVADSEHERIAIELSHPVWLVRLWHAELGENSAAELMRADNERAPTILRAIGDRNDAIRKLGETGLDCRPAEYAPAGIRAERPVTIPHVVIPQGEASQLVVVLLDAKPGEQVLDACAAPGGKSAYLAEAVGADGSVTAVDPGRDAAKRIRAALDFCNVSARIIERRVQDLELDRIYDAVLVDAPCSGLGTLREHPEIRWRRRPADLAAFGARQLEILTAAAGHVRRGGRLVYATCTLARVENEDVVDAFLRNRPDFAPDDPAGVHPALEPLVDEACRLRTFPHRHDTAGFFAQRFVRAQ